MYNDMNNDIERILLCEEEIDQITTELASRINSDYKDSEKSLILLVILKGSMPFASDLMRKIDIPAEIEFMQVSSYGAGTKASGEIKIHLDLLRENLEQYDLLIIEDVVDTGRAIIRLTQLLKNRNANSVKVCTLLDKPSCREVPFTPDYCGVEIPDEFVVGYGLDHEEKYRNLPYIGVLKEEVIEI